MRLRDSILNEIRELQSMIDSIKEYEVSITNDAREIELLEEYNDLAANLKALYEDLLITKEHELRKVSLEGII